MIAPMGTKITVGEWWVDPANGRIVRGSEVVRLEARTMQLLIDLAEHAGNVVSIDDLLDRVWAGVTVTPDSVYQAVTALRRLLGDNAKQPAYIVTVPRQGYRLIAPVTVLRVDPPAPKPRRAVRPLVIGGAVLALLCLFAVYQQVSRVHSVSSVAVAPAPVAVGVLPFLDFTDTMDQEALADDVTEGLVNRLSTKPELLTPSFRSSFLLKGKHASVAQAAKMLGVAYVIDGTVRKIGSNVRIAARLIRADTGFVIWSHTYDQPLGEIAIIQSDIAENVAKVLTTEPTSKQSMNPTKAG
jgi:transcriptional activator of cad operon